MPAQLRVNYNVHPILVIDRRLLQCVPHIVIELLYAIKMPVPPSSIVILSLMAAL
jgi:hypothetical protein